MSSIDDEIVRAKMRKLRVSTFAEVSTNLKEGELKNTGKEFGLGLDYEIPGLTTITGSIPEGKTPLDRTESGYGQGTDPSEKPL